MKTAIHYIDTHCHLQAEVFSQTLPGILADTQNAGIHCICNATEPSNWQRVLQIAREYRYVSAALGIHPWYIPESFEKSIASLYDYRNVLCAIGEAGLDSKYGGVPIKIQMQCFRLQLAAAREMGVPVIVHCIAAFDELTRILKETKPGVPIIIHAYNGSWQQAKSLAAFGCYFSIGGTATYRFSRKRAAMLEYIFAHGLMLLETDSPDIPPSQAPEGPNVPVNIIHVARSVAAYLGTSPEDAGKKAADLARKLFSLDTMAAPDV